MELSAERTRGDRLQAEIRRERDELEAVEMALADAKAELNDWEGQHTWQFTSAGSNDRPKEEKTRTSRRLNLRGNGDDDEGEEDVDREVTFPPRRRP